MFSVQNVVREGPGLKYSITDNRPQNSCLSVLLSSLQVEQNVNEKMQTPCVPVNL